MSYIRCNHVSFGYDCGTVLKDVNFEVNSGDYLCIVGENGSGKSTLVKGLLRLKNPSKGSIDTGDGLNPNEIGYLPQQSENQKDFPASVYEVVLSGRLNQLSYRTFFTRQDKNAAAEKMKIMGIDKIRNVSFQDLSGGQKQRVLLARALCATKKVLLLDEPVAGLDPVVTHEMYQLIKKINKELSITIIMVSHDINSAMKYASHILHLRNKQLFFGSKEDYLNSDIGKFFLSGEQNV